MTRSFSHLMQTNETDLPNIALHLLAGVMEYLQTVKLDCRAETIYLCQVVGDNPMRLSWGRSAVASRPAHMRPFGMAQFPSPYGAIPHSLPGFPMYSLGQAGPTSQLYSGMPQVRSSQRQHSWKLQLRPYSWPSAKGQNHDVVTFAQG